MWFISQQTKEIYLWAAQFSSGYVSERDLVIQLTADLQIPINNNNAISPGQYSANFTFTLTKSAFETKWLM